jgi:hypothetical protein
VKRKPWKIVAAFALTGLVIAAASYWAAALEDYTKPMTGFRLVLWTTSLILCPPQFLFVLCIDCEVIGMGGFIMYSIIGALNAALYAVVGAAFVGLRRGPSST